MPHSRLIKLTTPAPKPVARKRSQDAVEVIPRRCCRCRGTGHSVCTICTGAGQVLTGKDVFGRYQTTRCCGCFGTKTARCTTCAGTGWV